MNIFWAAIMGAVQGLTEFFPVSSSAHLTLFPWVFNYTDPGLSFDIALHAGTLIAIIIALRSDFSGMIKALFIKKVTFEKKMILFLLITSIPGAIFGYLLEDRAKTIFRAPLLTASVLLIFGVIMWLTDKYADDKNNMEAMSIKKSFIIGLAQAVAIIPGVSRSGATITAGRMLGFTREAAVKYSFLAAAPIIFGAAVFGLRNVPQADILSLPWVIGFIAALLSSLWAMKFLIKYVRNNNFNVFVWYRITLAIVIVLIYLWR
jgi:undecaprenyl-diphosphatase